jgi:WD40 repeat protein
MARYQADVEERRRRADAQAAEARARAEEERKTRTEAEGRLAAEQTALAESRTRVIAERRARRRAVGLVGSVALTLVLTALAIVALQLRHNAQRARLRANLAAIQDEGRRIVAEVAAIAEAGGPNQRADIDTRLYQFVDRRSAADTVVNDMRGRGMDESAANDHAWDEMSVALRRHVVPGPPILQLTRDTSIPLPSRDPSSPPLVAIRGDPGGRGIKEIVALDYSSESLHFVGPSGEPLRDGTAPRSWPLPEKLFRDAIRKTEVQRFWLSRTFSHMKIDYRAARLEYARDDRSLRLQIGLRAATWGLPSGKMKEETLAEHQLPHPLYGADHSSCDRYVAATEGTRTLVTVREWTSTDPPAVVWRAKGGNPAAGGERIRRLIFGPDQRALFILTNLRMAVVDAATGAAAETALEDADRIVHDQMIPFPGGVALVTKLPGKIEKDAFQLVVWRVTLPPANSIHVVRVSAPILCMALAGSQPRRIAVGAEDGVVHATEDVHRVKSFGIPYLGQAKAFSVRDDLALGRLPAASSFSVETLTGGPTGRKPTSFRRDAFAPGPSPFGGWGFVPDASLFTVERREAVSGGRSRVERVWYDPKTGQPLSPHPTLLSARAHSLSDDGAYIIVARTGAGRTTHQIVRLRDGRVVGAIAKPSDVVARVHLTEASNTTYVLATTQFLTGGAGCEFWRLNRASDQIEFLGQVFLPHFDCSIIPIPATSRAIAWRPRTVGSGPSYAAVLDLDAAQRVCYLDGFEALSSIEISLITPTRFIHATRQGLTGDQNDAYRIGGHDLTTGKRIDDLDAHVWNNIEAPEMELSPDGSRIALGGRLLESGIGCIRLYDLAKMRPIKEFHFDPIGTPRIARIANDYVVVEHLIESDQKASQLTHLAWSDGQVLSGRPADASEVVRVSRSFMGEYQWQLWSGPKGLLLQRGYSGSRIPLLETPPLEKTEAIQVHWPRDGGGTLALVGPLNGLWDAASGRRIREFPDGHRCLGFDARNRMALTVDSANHEIKVWDAEHGHEVAACRVDTLAAPGFDFAEHRWQLHGDGKCLAMLSQGVLQLWDLSTGTRLAMIQPPGHTSPVRLIAEHAGSGLIASAGIGGEILLWDRQKQSLVRTIIAQRFQPTALCFTPDGTQIVSAATDGSVAVHGIDGAIVWSDQLHDRFSATCLACAPGMLAAGMQDGRVITFNLTATTGTRGSVFPPGSRGAGAVRALTLSSDGARLAAGTDDGQVLVGDARSGKWDVERSAYAAVKGIAFVGGSRLLATAGQQVQFWDLDHPQASIWTIDVPNGFAQGLTYNNVSGELAVLDSRGDVVIYSLPDLYATLGRWGLGFAAAPAHWPTAPPSPSPPGPAPSRDEWRRRFTRFATDAYQQRSWGNLLWACAVELAQDPANARLWFLRGEAEKNQPDSRWIEAHRAYSQALEYDANDAKSFQARGDIRMLLDDLIGADNDYSKAMRLSEPDWQLFLRRALVRARLAELAAQKLTSKDVDALFGRVLADFTRVVTLNAAEWQSWRLIGELQSRLHNACEAGLAFRNAIDLAPHDPELYRLMIKYLREAGQNAAAIQVEAEMRDRFHDMLKPK